MGNPARAASTLIALGVALSVLSGSAGCKRKPKVSPGQVVLAECSAHRERALGALRAGQVAESENAFRDLQANVYRHQDGPGAIHQPVDGKTLSEWLREWSDGYRREVERASCRAWGWPRS